MRAYIQVAVVTVSGIPSKKASKCKIQNFKHFGHQSISPIVARELQVYLLDWVLSHWVHFTVHNLDLFVFICVYFVFFSYCI